MRKQYHFRQICQDTYIWDVDDLIQLSATFQTKEINLSEIKELLEPYWYPNSSPTTQEIIEHMQLVQAADLTYPIILCSQGRVMDGMHRVAKAKLLDHLTIKAVRFEITPPANFINIDEDDLDYAD